MTNEAINALAASVAAVIALLTAALALWQARIARRAADLSARQADAAERQARAAHQQTVLIERQLDEARRQGDIAIAARSREFLAVDRETARTLRELIKMATQVAEERDRTTSEFGSKLQRLYDLVDVARSRPPCRYAALETAYRRFVDRLLRRIDDILASKTKLVPPGSPFFVFISEATALTLALERDDAPVSVREDGSISRQAHG